MIECEKRLQTYANFCEDTTSNYKLYMTDLFELDWCAKGAKSFGKQLRRKPHMFSDASPPGDPTLDVSGHLPQLRPCGQQ